MKLTVTLRDASPLHAGLFAPLFCACLLAISEASPASARDAPLTAAATPAYSPKAGTYSAAQTVAISDTTPAAAIYYTTNGTTPTSSSTKYTAPIKVGKSETVKAIAVAAGFTASAVATAVYTIEVPAATPVFSPKAGTYITAQKVSITDKTAAATIHYTTNGTTPTSSSTKYTAPIAVTKSETIKAIAVAVGFTESAVASAAFTIEVPAATPVLSPKAGTYTTAQTVSISDSTSAATIHYTTDGSTPTASSTKYTAPIAVKSSETISAIAIAPGDSQSPVAAAAYHIGSSPIWSESFAFSFNGSDGNVPLAGLVMDGAGNLYGTTTGGGANDYGTVFKISASGAESVVYSFGNGKIDGSNPDATLILDGAGNLYGSTSFGGTYGLGTLFKISASGTVSALYAFGSSGTDDIPNAGLIRDSAGNFYGTTYGGGTNGNGTVFEISAAGKETVLYSFGPSGGSDGQHPYAGLITDGAGNFFGTTYEGGTNNTGTVFKLSASGAESMLYSFGPSGGTNAQFPHALLTMDGAGNFYGTTDTGGRNNTGAVFKVSASGAESVLYSFGTISGTDPRTPETALIMDGAGNLYGTTLDGGANKTGTVFEITASGAESVLYSFGSTSGTDARNPHAGLIFDSAGNLYGTTEAGGTHDDGTVFKLSPP